MIKSRPFCLENVIYVQHRNTLLSLINDSCIDQSRLSGVYCDCKTSCGLYRDGLFTSWILFLIVGCMTSNSSWSWAFPLFRWIEYATSSNVFEINRLPGELNGGFMVMSQFYLKSLLLLIFLNFKWMALAFDVQDLNGFQIEKKLGQLFKLPLSCQKLTINKS